MPGGSTRPDPPGEPPRSDTGKAREYLEAALRAARADAILAGVDPDAVTADLAERLHRVRRMLADDRQGSSPDDG